jgi:F-type H+-transporting ATPase subunit delta
MSDIRIASRYAKALIDQALEENKLERLKEDADLFLSLIKENRDFAILLLSPIVSTDKKKIILDKLWENKLDTVTIQFIHLVLKKRREAMLRSIFTEFNRQYNRYKKITEATVFTAIPISEKLKKEIREMLERKTDSKIELEEKIDESIIGGYIIRYEDKLIDSSIATQIRQLQKILVN